MLLRPNQYPWAILASELSGDLVGSIMIFKPGGQVVRLVDVEFPAEFEGCMSRTSHMAPEVGFEPTTNRLIPSLSGLYH